MTALHAVPDDTDGQRYGAMETCAFAGITFRQCDYWTRAGLLGDSRQVGSGHSRSYTLDEIELLRLVKPLTDHGLNVRAAFDIARHAIEHGAWTARIADIYEITVRIAPTQEATG